jgi:hypothetical protein
MLGVSFEALLPQGSPFSLQNGDKSLWLGFTLVATNCRDYEKPADGAYYEDYQASDYHFFLCH